LKTLKFLKRRHILLVLLALTVIFTGCVGHRNGVSWAALSLVGDENNILVSFKDYMVLIDPATGRPVQLRNPEGDIRTDEEGNPRRWEVNGDDTDSQFYSLPLLINENTYLIADYNKKLITINIPNARVDDPDVATISGPVISDITRVDGMILVAMSNQNVIALDASNYEQQWVFETDRGVWASPLVIDETVYIPSMGHNLYSVDIKTGNEIWRRDLGGAIAATPAYNDGHLYIGSFDRKLFDISAETGEILGEYEVGDWMWSTPVLVDGILYTTDMSGGVFALNIEDGLTEVWQSHPATKGIRARPLVTGSYVIVASRDGNVYWLERETGKEIFHQTVGEEILSDILLVQPSESLDIPEPLVVVSTEKDNKVLVAFTLEGAPRWTYER
jgi:outer membrane protein assembly factor BamB